MLLLALGCAEGLFSSLSDPSDPIGHFEYGDALAPDFSFRASKVLGFQCTDADGVEWLYVHAYTSTAGPDCSTDEIEDDYGNTFPSSYDNSCGGIEAALEDAALDQQSFVACGAGMVPNDRRHQLSVWLSDFDPQWPIDAVFGSGRYQGCDADAVPEGVIPSVAFAGFTPDEYSDEILISGAMHGVAQVDYCQ
ncbi:MAG: hypothetical protein VX899_16600 [Myxococcota bacterium]|nr:hypothetical protein [Myxococcota bacterium]